MRFLWAGVLCFFIGQAMAGQGISPYTYEKLTRIQALLGEGKLPQAAGDLDDLLKDVANAPLAMALTLQTYAQLEMQRNQLPAAQQRLQQALKIDNLDEATRNQLRVQSAQIYFSQGDYAALIQSLQPWLQTLPTDAPATAFALLGAGFYAQEKFAPGLPFIEEAIKRSGEIKEPWLLLAFAGCFQTRQYDRALYYSDILLSHFPDKKDYWLQKSGMLQLQNKLSEAAAVRYAASNQGFAFSDAEVVSYAQLLGVSGAPLKTGQVLNQLGQQKTLDEKERRLLLQAWLQAREREKARAVLQSLFDDFARIEDGVWLLQMQVDAELWSAVLPLAGQLLDKKLDNKQHGLILIYQGIALYRLNKTDAALESMQAASRYNEVKSQADAWRQYMLQMRQQN
ncbi:MAG: hypothetical protein H7A09_04975 [Oceanospirillaceae bacterium]|nr:hypothetical protein [Oceanospirillaceae bacterium]MCP5349404.1 hypothetical protein [Oceanospirillaceae bacterium]